MRAAGRVLYVATADARGHLMRAQLLATELEREGLEVDLVTTSDEGAAFLARFGRRAAVLSRDYRVEFDARHNMSRGRTDRRILTYVLRRRGMARDVARLAELARGADLVVNDSNHPALLFAPFFPKGRSMRIVHLYGRNLRAAVEQNFAGRLPAPFARAYARLVGTLYERGFARLEHTFAAPLAGASHGATDHQLPPVCAVPEVTPEATRAALGVAPGERLAVIYLNPHFRDPSLARALESTLAARGYRVHAVGEGFAGRPGWRATDPRLVDAVAAADLLVSGAGMGALAQARAFGTPLLILRTDQPEQEANLAFLAGAGHPHAAARCDGDASTLEQAFARALDGLPADAGAAQRWSAGRDRTRDALHTWGRVMAGLVGQARAA